jgi:hypothetical protein
MIKNILYLFELTVYKPTNENNNTIKKQELNNDISDHHV